MEEVDRDAGSHDGGSRKWDRQRVKTSPKRDDNTAPQHQPLVDGRATDAFVFGSTKDVISGYLRFIYNNLYFSPNALNCNA